jgi:hypothetical protein
MGPEVQEDIWGSSRGAGTSTRVSFPCFECLKDGVQMEFPKCVLHCTAARERRKQEKSSSEGTSGTRGPASPPVETTNPPNTKSRSSSVGAGVGEPDGSARRTPPSPRGRQPSTRATRGGSTRRRSPVRIPFRCVHGRAFGGLDCFKCKRGLGRGRSPTRVPPPSTSRVNTPVGASTRQPSAQPKADSRRAQGNIEPRRPTPPKHGVRNRAERRGREGGLSPDRGRGQQNSARRVRFGLPVRIPSPEAGDSNPENPVQNGPEEELDLPVRGAWRARSYYLARVGEFGDLLHIPWVRSTSPGHRDCSGQSNTWVKGVDSNGKPTWYACVPAEAVDHVGSRIKHPDAHMIEGVIVDRLSLSDRRQFLALAEAAGGNFGDYWFSRPVCLELLAYLVQYATFRPRTYELLGMLRNRAIAWCKEFRIASAMQFSILAPSVAMAFRILESERDALRMLRDVDVSQDIQTSVNLSQGKPFETERWSFRGMMSGRYTVGSGLSRLVGRFTNPRVGIPLPSKK